MTFLSCNEKYNLKDKLGQCRLKILLSIQRVPILTPIFRGETHIVQCNYEQLVLN